MKLTSVFPWMEVLCFLLSGAPASGTLAAEIGYMFGDWYRPDSTLEFPVGGSGAIVDALVGRDGLGRQSFRRFRRCQTAGIFRKFSHFLGNSRHFERIWAIMRGFGRFGRNYRHFSDCPGI